MFADQIRNTMEVYVDNMFVKNVKPDDNLCHLTETFGVLRKYDMKLNPSKCASRVVSVGNNAH